MTIRCVELVGRKKFAVATLDLEYKTYIVYIKSVSSDASPTSSTIDVHFLKKSKISGLIVEKAPTKVSSKYLDFASIFSLDLASELSKHTEINDHVIKLVNGQQPLYRPIYSPRPVELETLKAYMETNLVNGFIKLSKSLSVALILFDRKSDNFLQFYINYQDLNNLMIKNQYPLPLIEESLNRLERARWFTQLKLISTYHQMRIRKGNK